MFNLDDITNKNDEDYNNNWPYVPDHLCRILVIGTFWSVKTNKLLNLIKEQDDIYII